MCSTGTCATGSTLETCCVASDPTPQPTFPVPTPAPTMTKIATLSAATPWSLTAVILMLATPVLLALGLFRWRPLRLQYIKNMLFPCFRNIAIRGITSDLDADATVAVHSDPGSNVGLKLDRRDEGGPYFVKEVDSGSPLSPVTKVTVVSLRVGREGKGTRGG